MKLRKLARQLAAAAVAGAMALSFCMPALAETWDMSNTEKYPNGNRAQISVARYANDPRPEFNGQFLYIQNYGGEPDPIKEKDEAPVFSGNFKTLGLSGYEGTTVHAALQDAHIEYDSDSNHTLTTGGKVELTLSGSNTVTHNNTYKLAINIGDSGYPSYTPGLLTIKGSGSLTATNNLSNGIRIDNGTLDVTDGTVDVTAAENGIDARGSTVQVSGGTLRVTATGEHGRGIDANYNGNITVSGGALCVTAKAVGIDASNNGNVTVSGGTLTVSGGNFGIAVDQLEMSGGTLNASANGTVAITGASIAVNGGVLNLENNAAPDGIISQSLEVTNGRLTAKGQTVSANSITVSRGWVEADTLEPRESDASSRTVDLSGGNVKLKNMPVGTVTFSGSARLTIDKTVPLADITALAEAFRSGSTTQSAYLKYIPANPAELPEGAVMEGSYAVLHGKDFPDEGPVYGDEPSGESTDTGTAPAGDAGGAIAAVAIGGAALWGGYEVATRVILHKLLPEGAAIPKTQAQLALLLWNTAGQPEPANDPAFADVDAATAKAAQWCTEQGYLSGTFKPDKRVAKYNVIRTWNKAFPKAKDL